MVFWVGRLFLLLLLGCDFYFDPGNGLSPLDRPMCSTPAPCQAMQMRRSLRQTIAESAELTTSESDAGAVPASMDAASVTLSARREDSLAGLSFVSSFLFSAPLYCLLQRLHR